MPTPLSARNADRLAALGLKPSQIATLYRAEKALHRWAELECGDSNSYASWCIERDPITDKPYRVTYPHHSSSYREPVRDAEKAALVKVAAVCAAAGLHFITQGDPRGGILFISREPLTLENTHTAGVCVA